MGLFILATERSGLKTLCGYHFPCMVSHMASVRSNTQNTWYRPYIRIQEATLHAWYIIHGLYQDPTFQLPAVDISIACADIHFVCTHQHFVLILSVVKNMPSLELTHDLTGQVTKIDRWSFACGGSADIYKGRYLERTVSICASLSVSAA